MNDTPSLFPDDDYGTSRKLARRDDPVTSHIAAAGHVASGQNAAQRLAVLNVVKQQPGLTSDEIAEVLGVSRYIPARRLSELERHGCVSRGNSRPSRITGRDGLTWWPVTR